MKMQLIVQSVVTAQKNCESQIFTNCYQVDCIVQRQWPVEKKLLSTFIQLHKLIEISVLK